MKSVKTYLPAYHGENMKDIGMKYRRLGQTDMNVSYYSFGASALGSVFRQTDDEEAYRVVQMMVRAGVNYIDTAPWYGHGKSEQVLGRALKDIPRECYYIATKVARYNPEPSDMFDFSYARTLASVEKSLNALGLPSVDLIQVHDVEFAPSLKIVLDETLPALQKIKDERKTRYIGEELFLGLI